VPRLGEWFASSPFRARFEAKGRFSDYLADIPTWVITTPNPAFHGVATILAEHLRGRSGANTLMERITQLRHELSPAEGRVASLVIDQPRMVLNEPIAEIARLADVSQPTVIRFCRSLGFQGLADFKLKFASSLTGSIPVRHSQVRLSDSASSSTRWAIRARWRSMASTSSSASASRPRCMATRTCSRWPPSCWGRATW
jgi:glucokinase